MTPRRNRIAVAAVVLASLLGLTVSCSSDETAAPAGVSDKPLRPKQFDDRRRSPRPRKTPQERDRLNQWLPIDPGIQVVKDGRVNVGHRRLTHRIVNTVTDVTKRIGGVRTTLVLDQDFNGGELAEQALDYVAEDKRGNVWYLGSYTETYEGGEFVNATDAWLTGINGAKAGILMKAHPKPGMTYYQATVPGEGSAYARVVKTGASQCVPFKCYKDVVVTQEGTSEPEYKYYAPGVGGILTEPHYSGGEQEIERLVNFTQLSPRGLAEISAEALRLDRHARAVVPDVFGNSPAAKRAR
jgi:hypothetical protein